MKKLTVYQCKHVRRGDFGEEVRSLEPFEFSCADCREESYFHPSFLGSEECVEEVATAIARAYGLRCGDFHRGVARACLVAPQRKLGVTCPDVSETSVHDDSGADHP